MQAFHGNFFLFADEARSNQKGVLVHCLAGVSRSVTITVAYLMYKMSLSLNDAFNLVRSRKSNIAPNFHFMEQLYNFERELQSQPGWGHSRGDSVESVSDPIGMASPADSLATPDSSGSGKPFIQGIHFATCVLCAGRHSSRLTAVSAREPEPVIFRDRISH